MYEWERDEEDPKTGDDNLDLILIIVDDDDAEEAVQLPDTEEMEAVGK